MAIFRFKGEIPHGAIAIETLKTEFKPDDIVVLSTLGWTGQEGFFLGFHRFLKSTEKTLEYLHVSGGGASGSPVFDANTGELICVHKRGGFIDEQSNHVLGECTKMSSIIEAIRNEAAP